MKTERFRREDFIAQLQGTAERVIARAVEAGTVDPVVVSRLIVQNIREDWAGTRVEQYIARSSRDERRARRAEVALLYNGRNGPELMAQFSISERQLRRIVAEHRGVIQTGSLAVTNAYYKKRFETRETLASPEQSRNADT